MATTPIAEPSEKGDKKKAWTLGETKKKEGDPDTTVFSVGEIWGGLIENDKFTTI